MIAATKKWIFLKLSSIKLIPLMLWFIMNLVFIYDKGLEEVVIFLTKESSRFLTYSQAKKLVKRIKLLQ